MSHPKPTGRRRTAAPVFYGLILGGLLLGGALAAVAGWVYREFGDREPTGRRIWDGMADEFVVPICVMVGATFGGLAGLGAGVSLDVIRMRKGDDAAA